MEVESVESEVEENRGKSRSNRVESRRFKRARIHPHHLFSVNRSVEPKIQSVPSKGIHDLDWPIDHWTVADSPGVAMCRASALKEPSTMPGSARGPAAHGNALSPSHPDMA
jgi:hypothetical protein